MTVQTILLPQIVQSNNPRIKLGNDVPVPSDPTVTRYTFTRVDFDLSTIRVYGTDVNVQDTDPEVPEDFDPAGDDANLLMQYMYFWNLKHVRQYYWEGDQVPVFVNPATWNNALENAASGFISGVGSMMPKIIIPSQALLANGVLESDATQFARISDVTNNPSDEDYYENIFGKDGFNWKAEAVQGAVPSTLEKRKKFDRSGSGVAFTSRHKSDDSDEPTIVVLTLPEPTDPPDAADKWTPAKLVGQGAFCLFFNITPCVGGTGSPSNAKSKWIIEFIFGEVYVRMDDNGKAIVKIGEEVTEVQLLAADAKEVPPQFGAVKGDLKYILLFYPVWNGLVVQNGVQDVRTNVNVSSRFCVKTKTLNINNSDYHFQGQGGAQGVFDPDNPADIFISVNKEGATSNEAVVDFGEEIYFNMIGCRFQVAYVPAFFSAAAVLDSFFISPKDVDPDEAPPSGVVYTHTAYAIWTDNRTSYEVRERLYNFKDVGLEGFEDAEWKFDRIGIKSSDELPGRRAAECFGYLLRSKERRGVSTITDNGEFPLDTATTATYSANVKRLQDWIKAVNITTSLDGINGQLTIDKYGYIGQTSDFEQAIGGITVDVDKSPSPYTPETQRLFTGLGMGFGDTASSDGADATVPLVGLTKKMEDIVLINVPFFDGYKLEDVVDFLCRYAGINYSLAHADGDSRLDSSTDISAPLVDFKTGTTVLDALNQVMELSHHNFVMSPDGVLLFYELEEDGLPPASDLGPDRREDYPNVKIMSIDRTPDFEDLRNEIVVIGLQEIKTEERQPTFKVSEAGGASNSVLLPLILTQNQHDEITPRVPWSKPMVYGVPGFVTEEKLEDIMDNVSRLTKVYELTGSVSIPGDPRIVPYDRFGEYIIYSVTHSIDLQAKTWTTSFELASGKLV